MGERKRIRLTAAEIAAILSAAGNCDARAMFDDMPDEAEGDRAMEAYESGMDKLREMLAARRNAMASGRD